LDPLCPRSDRWDAALAHRERLLRIARARTLTPEDAEDIVQEAMLRCVEFEATRKDSLEAALAVVEKYERATGFDSADRTRRPLIEIMFPDVIALLAPQD